MPHGPLWAVRRGSGSFLQGTTTSNTADRPLVGAFLRRSEERADQPIEQSDDEQDDQDHGGEGDRRGRALGFESEPFFEHA